MFKLIQGTQVKQIYYSLVLDGMQSKLQFTDTYVYIYYDIAPSTENDKTSVNPLFQYGPLCGGMTHRVTL